ncbi:putative questin oxidase [Septoria linicola]|nr:putative questin oxidase [Septoria linicola]
MATASTVQLGSVDHPQFYREGLSQAATTKVNKLLQDNHEQHHIFFNASGFHNHIAHHLLTTWSLNASPEDLQRSYDTNKSYQRAARKPTTTIVEELHDPKKFISYLGPEKYYNDFLEFFREEINKKGWQNVLQEYVFAGDERAETMLVRMYAGFLHPIIHLGFGIEFQQPTIIAEALAQAACHEDWIGKLFLPAEQAAQNNGNDKTIVELLDEIHANKDIRESVKWSDGNKIRDGLLTRSPQPLVSLLSQVHITPSTLSLKTAEMTNAAIYYTAAAQRPNKAVKVDFYFMHCVNASIFWPTFNRQTWLSEAMKVRLLEWKIRLDLAMYASRKSPDIRLEDIREYTPKKPSGWEEVFDRACKFDDDGHASKLVRAVANGEKVCGPFAGEKGFRLEGKDWLQIGHMVIDSVELQGDTWLRSVGFDEAWKEVPERKGARL